MTEELNPITPPVSPTEAPVVAPTPVAPTPVTPVAEAPAPAVEAPAAPVEVTETPSVLGEAIDKSAAEAPKEGSPEAPAEVTPETKTPEPEKKEGQSEEPAPPPTFDEFKLPENTQVAPELIKEFTDMLGAFELDAKTDHAKLQEFGQKAVDFHTREVKKTVETVLADTQKLYTQNWENMKTKWKDEFLNDPEIGGNRAQTTIDSALGFIRTIGSPEEQKAFRQLMDSSGLGNHPTMIRILANAGRALSEGRPLAATTPVTAPKSRTEAMYGTKKVYF